MATSANGSVSIIDDFEEACSQCITALLSRDALNNSSPAVGQDGQETRAQAEQLFNQFLDTARQTEAHFLQTSFLMTAQKPEEEEIALLRQETHKMKLEMARKDALLQAHYAKLEDWKARLNDAGMPYPSQAQKPKVTTNGEAASNGHAAGSSALPNQQRAQLQQQQQLLHQQRQKVMAAAARVQQQQKRQLPPPPQFPK